MTMKGQIKIKEQYYVRGSRQEYDYVRKLKRFNKDT